MAALTSSSAAEDVIQLHAPAHDKTVYANTSQLIAAEEPDFPAFLFSEREFHRSVKVFKKGFDGLQARGTLWGGNLCMVVSLLGTPHWPRVKGGVLFLEDVNEHP